MSEANAQEPSMEEILASIRRIISEDEAPAEGEPAVPEPEPAAAKVAAEIETPAAEPTISGSSEAATVPEYEPSFAVEPELPPMPDLDDQDDGDLELTQRVETLGDLDVMAPPAPAPEPVAAPPIATLVSAHVATATAASFSALTSGLLVPRSDRTLEDVVRDLLTPLLKAWLDENLQRVVDEAVRAEVDRISRLGAGAR